MGHRVTSNLCASILRKQAVDLLEWNGAAGHLTSLRPLAPPPAFDITKRQEMG